MSGPELVLSDLKGDTGPLVYPAGFVYLYSGLYYLTDHGNDIAHGQVLFVGFYLIHLVRALNTYVIIVTIRSPCTLDESPNIHFPIHYFEWERYFR